MVPVPSRKIGKEKLARLAQVVKPAAQRDFLPVKFSNILDGHDWHAIGLLSFQWQFRPLIFAAVGRLSTR